MSAVAVVDPGTTTGIAWTPRPCHEKHLHKRLNVVEIKGMDDIDTASRVVERLREVQYEHGLEDVVWEDFILMYMNRDRRLLSPVRVTAAGMALCAERGLHVVHHLQPSSSMSVVTDDRLRDLQLWTPGMEHARAATKHLVVRLRKLRERSRR